MKKRFESEEDFLEALRQGDLDDKIFPLRGKYNSYTDDQARQVCELLMNPNMTYKEIEAITGVRVATISSIYSGKIKRYNRIAIEYNFPSRESKLPQSYAVKRRYHDHRPADASSLVKQGRVGRYTEEQIRQVCEMLTDIRNTYRDIAAVTGVDEYTIFAISNKRVLKWSPIYDDYTFPVRRHRRDAPTFISSRNGHRKYSDEKIRQICDKLMDIDHYQYLKDISAEEGVSISFISALYRKQLRTDITSKYNFPEHPQGGTRASDKPHDTRSWKFDAGTIETICQLLDLVYYGDSTITYDKIEMLTGVSRSMISRINTGKAWTRVSKDHDFYKYQYA